jgi:sugar phosphate isomerase/epimerase
MSAARILFSTGSLYLFDLSYCFELAAEAGYDGIEVMCDERYSSRDPEYLKRLSDQFNLPILVCHTPFSPRTPGWRDQYNEVQRVNHTIKLAEQLNAETIVVHLPDRVGQVTVKISGRTIYFPWRKLTNPIKDWMASDLAAAQEKTPVKIAIENMPIRTMAGKKIDPCWWNDIESWSKVHQWLTLDTTHWATKKIDPLDAYRAAGERVAHVHLSNYDGDEHKLPHKGSLNLKTLLRAMAADGYNRTISLELSPFSLSFREMYLVRRNLRDSLKFVRDNFA